MYLNLVDMTWTLNTIYTVRNTTNTCCPDIFTVAQMRIWTQLKKTNFRSDTNAKTILCIPFSCSIRLPWCGRQYIPPKHCVTIFKRTIGWVVVKRDSHVSEEHRIHLQGRRISQAAWFCWFLARPALRPWKRRRYISPKRRALFELRRVTTQKTVFIIGISVRNSDVTVTFLCLLIFSAFKITKSVIYSSLWIDRRYKLATNLFPFFPVFVRGHMQKANGLHGLIFPELLTL
jgi:hypothetical protein